MHGGGGGGKNGGEYFPEERRVWSGYVRLHLIACSLCVTHDTSGSGNQVAHV